jgi:hypothetical protein
MKSGVQEIQFAIAEENANTPNTPSNAEDSINYNYCAPRYQALLRRDRIEKGYPYNSALNGKFGKKKYRCMPETGRTFRVQTWSYDEIVERFLSCCGFIERWARHSIVVEVKPTVLSPWL